MKLENWKASHWLWLLGGLALIVVVAKKCSEWQDEKKSREFLVEYNSPKAVAERAKADSLRELNEISNLARQLRAVGKTDYLRSYDTGNGDFLPVEILLSSERSLVQQGQRSSLDSISTLAKVAEKKLRAAQLKVYPQLRARWVREKADAVWEHDIYLTHYGTTLMMTGAVFASNSVIKTYQEKLYKNFEVLRFKQTQYRWYKGQDEFTYYTIASKADSDITP